MASLADVTSRYRELCVERYKRRFNTTPKALIIYLEEKCEKSLRPGTGINTNIKIKILRGKNKRAKSSTSA